MRYTISRRRKGAETTQQNHATEWAKTTKDQKAVLGEEQTEDIKAKLDEAYLAGLTEKQRRTSVPVSRTEEESLRPHPTNGPRWAVRSD